MAVFDQELWRSRAQARYQRARASQGEDAAGSHWTRDCAHVAALAVLVDWCTERGIEVVFCRRGGGIYYPEKKRIKISGRLLPERQVHFLLHECGHHLIGDSEKHERFSMGYSQDDPVVTQTFRHRCDVVDEEYEAWWRGAKLAKRLRLSIDKESFNRTRAEMLKTYFKWALKTDGYGRDEDDDEDDPEKEAVAGR